MSGTALIGGDNGFEATISGFLDAIDLSFQLNVSHPGGWEPIPDIKSPAFEALLAVGPGSYLDLYAAITFNQSLSLGPLHLVGHPTRGTPGASMAVTVERAAQLALDDPIDWEVRFDGGVKIATLPTASFSGYASNTGALFTVYMPQFLPFPDELPGLELPSATGELRLTYDGNLSVSVVLASPEFSLFDIVTFYDFYASVAVDVNIHAGLESLEVEIQLRTSLLIGGPDGFLANASGSLSIGESSEDTELRMAVHHAGGWSPFAGNAELERIFSTPMFDTTFAIGPASYIHFSVDVQFPGAIELIEGIALVGHPDLGKPGVSLFIEVERAADIETNTAASISYDVRVDGALKIGESDQFPVISMIGSAKNGSLHLPPENIMHTMANMHTMPDTGL